MCETVEVFVPRPYVPPFFALFVSRWKAYAAAVQYEVRNGVAIYRPATPVVPRLGGALWVDRSAFFWCRRIIGKRHLRVKFDAILSFDLLGAGGLAWRIGRYLSIPAGGWATGGDVRVPASSSYGRVVIRALQNLSIVFYQSRELLQEAAKLLRISLERMPYERHLVLPRGIAVPPVIQKRETRKRVRTTLGIAEDQVLILSIGRISREKGVYELLQAVSSAAAQNPKIVCVLVGSLPAFDETLAVREHLRQNPNLEKQVQLLSACDPEKVWEYLCAADIFAFTSYHEGMPNSLLEAMATGAPAIAFGIPPILEIEDGVGTLLVVPPFNATEFAKAILRLAASPCERSRLGEIGRTRVMDRYMVEKNMTAAITRLAQIHAE